MRVYQSCALFALALPGFVQQAAAQDTASSTSSDPSLFTIPASSDNGLPIIPNLKDPEAVNAQDVCPGYTASDVSEGTSGFSATLRLAGAPCNVYGTDVDQLTLTVEYQSDERVAVRIQPSNLDSSNSSYYILDEAVVQRPNVSSGYTSKSRRTFSVSWTNDPTFSFTVNRTSNNDVIFSTAGSKLVYENQFIEFVTSMPQDYNVYGLGERVHQLRLGTNFSATTYAADQGTPLDSNIYGTHPVYLDTRYYEIQIDGSSKAFRGNETNANGNYSAYSHAVYNRNAHGQEVLLRESNITWRLLGGSVDLFFFDGPSAPEAIANYQSAATGYPAMQQYWSFGYNQCRWGYSSWAELQQVVQTFKDFDIPLETIWSDIDYMFKYRDFTVDPVNFGVDEGKQFFQQLHANGQHYIPIVDSAIYIPNPQNESDAYASYTRGNESGVFLSNPDGSQYIGAVWPGYTVFPDWHSQNAVSWWTDELMRWYGEVQFDGIWIDMSEASSFCVGSCGTGNVTLNPAHVPFLLPGEPGNVDYNYPEGFNKTNATEAASASAASASQAAQTSTTAASSTSTSYFRSTPTPNVRNINHPPYAINNALGDLAVHALSPNATHADGVVDYDVHNLWGHQILNATYQALLHIFEGRRPAIIGRSTFAGSGKYAGHWLGDNNSKWTDMFFAIPGSLAMSIFGIPWTGPDTCGFAGNSDEELCNRWMQLSAFFPFYRNHNVLKARSQEPYVWSSVIDATKKAMKIRYSLLPYIYTLFYHAHTSGSTVMRALPWEFPAYPSLRDADRQFLLGPALLVTPVLNQGADTVDGVFPGIGRDTRWYDWYTQEEVTNVTTGSNVTISAPLGHIPLFVRGGYVLPMQEPGYTTAESRNGTWSLLAALDTKGNAAGDLYLDDGYSLVPEQTRFVAFSISKNTLSVSIKGDYAEVHPIANVTVLGLAESPVNATLNGQALGTGSVCFNGTSKVLQITGLEQATRVGAWSQDWTLSWS